MFLACAQRLCGNCSLALPPTCFLKPQEGLGRAGGVVSSHVLVEYAIWHPPRLSTRHFLPAPAPEVKPGLGRGWGVAGGWPGSSQHPSSPALSPCHIKHTHTHGAALHSCPQEALSGQLPLLSQHPGLAAAPQNPRMRTHTYQAHRMYTCRTHARTRQVRSVTWDCSSPTRAVSSEMFPSSTFSFVSGRLYYRLLRDVTGNISHVAPRRA